MPDVCEYSLITKGDMYVYGKQTYSKIAAGGRVEPGGVAAGRGFNFGGYTRQINGEVYYEQNGRIGRLCESTRTIKWNCAGGKTQKPLSELFDWSDFEWLAQHIKNSPLTEDLQTSPVYQNGDGDDFVVRVYTQGGRYTIDDILHEYRGTASPPRGYDKGRTLAVFNTAEDILLTKDTESFGPSVLAPFSCVTLAGHAGYIDGFLVAKQFGKCNSYPDSADDVQRNIFALQHHGDCYKGPIECTST